MTSLIADYKNQKSLEERQAEFNHISNKYSGRIPTIVVSKDIILDKHKYLVPLELTISQLQFVLRKNIKNLKPEEAMFIFTRNELPASSEFVSQVYKRVKDDDGFLYLVISKENCFG